VASGGIEGLLEGSRFLVRDGGDFFGGCVRSPHVSVLAASKVGREEDVTHDASRHGRSPREGHGVVCIGGDLHDIGCEARHAVLTASPSGGAVLDTER
jgi:hypothetical protein